MGQLLATEGIAIAKTNDSKSDLIMSSDPGSGLVRGLCCIISYTSYTTAHSGGF
jgi:hypothetical protein